MTPPRDVPLRIAALDALSKRVNKALAEARQAVVALHASPDATFGSLLREVVEDYADRFGLDVECVVGGEPDGLPERSAGEIHRALADVTFGAVSQHLRALDEGGLVAMRRDGRHRLYRARREALGPVATTLEALWSDALYRLTLHAELEAARRGPHSKRRRRRRRNGGHP